MTPIRTAPIGEGKTLVMARVKKGEELAGMVEPRVIEDDGYLLYSTREEELGMKGSMAIYFESMDRCKEVFEKIFILNEDNK